MPYCRICGAQLEENARFCHKCGTPIVICPPAPPPPPPAKPVQKHRVSPEIVALIVVVAVAVIVSLVVFSLFYSTNFNQTNDSNQTNVSRLNFHVQGGIPNVNVLAQNLTSKTSFINSYTNNNDAEILNRL